MFTILLLETPVVVPGLCGVECSGGRGSVLRTKSSNPQTTFLLVQPFVHTATNMRIGLICIFRLGYLLLGGGPGLCTGMDPVDISVLSSVPKNGLS